MINTERKSDSVKAALDRRDKVEIINKIPTIMRACVPDTEALILRVSPKLPECGGRGEAVQRDTLKRVCVRVCQINRSINKHKLFKYIKLSGIARYVKRSGSFGFNI